MDAMEKLFAERRDLAVSLKDTKSVVGKLESVIGVGIHIIFVFIYMLVFNVDVMKTYLALSSLVLAFSFIFQNSIRTVSACLILKFNLLFGSCPSGLLAYYKYVELTADV